MKKLHKLNLIETVFFIIGLSLLITGLVVWWSRFLEVHKYLIMTV